MALSLHFSNNIHDLFTIFSKETEGESHSPFVSPQIIAPSAIMHKWIQLRLAHKNKIVYGYDKLYLENFIWKTLQPANNQRRLNAQILQVIILKKINELFERRLEDLDPLFAYLKMNEKLHPSKTIALSARLASLYLEYDLGRPDVRYSDGTLKDGATRTWLNKDYFNLLITNAPKSLIETEKWQRFLFKQIFPKEPGILVTNDKAEYFTLPALFNQRIKDPEFITALKGAQPCHLFAPAGMSHFHRNFIQFYSEHSDFYVYQLNPCSNFWEDVDISTKRCLKWTSNSDPRLKFRPDSYQSEEFSEICFETPIPKKDMRLLELWGQTGKENIALWCQATDYNFEYSDREVAARTVLTISQEMLRLRQSDHPDKSEQDDSIQIWQAPDLYRECEQLAENIQAEMKKNPKLKFSDIAVYVPDINSYQPYLELVFDRFTPSGKLPVIINGKNSGNSEYARAVKSFFDLWNSNFSRKNVLQFLRNTLVLNKIGVNRETLRTWEAWIDSLNIFHSWNRDHRTEMGEKEVSDLHSWEWGINRLIAGTLTDNTMSLGDNTNPEELLGPYSDMESQNHHSLNLFIETLQCLFSDLKTIQQSESKNLETQIFVTASILHTWIQPFKDDVYEKSIQSDFINSLFMLKIRTESSDNSNEDPGLQTEKIKQWLLSNLNNELPASSEVLSGSVVISELKSGIILPSKLIFLVGMNGADFPGQKSESTLNLMSHKRIIGDLNPVRQRQYLFLETILNAEEKLIISYRSQNIVKDEELPPSSVVTELLNFLNQSVLKNKFKQIRVPLVVHEVLLDAKTDYTALDYSAYTIKKIRQENPTAMVKRESLWPAKEKNSEPESTDDFTRIELSLKDISDFITEPKKWYLKRTTHLRVYDDEGDTGQREWERLGADSLQTWSILERALNYVVNKLSKGEPSDPDQEELLEESVISGDCPDGVLKEIWKESVTKDIPALINPFKNNLDDHKDNLQFYVPIGSIFRESSDLILRDETSKTEFVISDEIPILLKQSEFERVIIDYSASKIRASGTAWSASKIKHLIPHVLRLLVLKILGTAENFSLNLTFFEKFNPEKPAKWNISDSFDKNPEEARDILCRLLRYMYRWKSDANALYYECPLAAVYEGESVRDHKTGYQNLQYWIHEDEQKTSNRSYKRPRVLSVQSDRPPTEKEWSELMDTVFLPFIEGIRGPQ
jgi:exodeoxyribonuclease V gamma subunit